MKETMNRQKELTQILERAARAYYSENEEIMSNYQYDALYDELADLEQKTGVILAGSPTNKVGYAPVSGLKEVQHEKGMLSLKKTKDRNELKEWLQENTGFLSWKLDGLTLVLTYEDGNLKTAVTRGNGEVGEDVTHNAPMIHGIPMKIPYQEKLIVRGECLMTYSAFQEINKASEKDFQNPRNLAAGTIRSFDPTLLKERPVEFHVFTVLGESLSNSYSDRLNWTKNLGFSPVEGTIVTADNILDAIEAMSLKISQNDFPSDGLVLMLDDIAYGESLGTTAKYPKNAMAFKWQDETKETTLRRVEWSASKTGTLTPVAVFDTVSLEGTDVSRASLKNVSILKAMQLGIGDTLTVYKADMIIPQIAENLTRSNTLEIPCTCPVCGGRAEIKKLTENSKTEILVCVNPSCASKEVGRFVHFASREGMNMKGVSESILADVIDTGHLKQFSDLFHLQETDAKEQLLQKDGYGEKSWTNLTEAIEKSRTVKFSNLITALGIPEVGPATAKILTKLVDSAERLLTLSEADLAAAEGIGSIIAASFCRWMTEHHDEFVSLLPELQIQYPQTVQAKAGIQDKTFVVTGSVHIWKNRKELQAAIEAAGGKVASSISTKTNYLVNNDTTSSSSKNQKAKQLGIPVISEEELQALLN